MITQRLDEAINNLSYPVFSSQWTLEDTTPILYKALSKRIPYLVKSVELPKSFFSLEMDKTYSGEPYYNKAEINRDWSVTLVENVNLEAFTYFKRWHEEVFDPTTFMFDLSVPARTFKVTLYTSRLSEVDRDLLMSKEAKNFGVSVLDSLTSSAIGRLARLFSQLTENRGTLTNTLLNRSLGTVKDAGTEALGDKISSPLEDTNIHGEHSILEWEITGVKIKSIESLTLDYEQTNKIEWKIDLSCERCEMKDIRNG